MFFNKLRNVFKKKTKAIALEEKTSVPIDTSKKDTELSKEELLLLDFLKGEGEDFYGRTIAFILGHKGNSMWLEGTHDYIQWLFPLREASNAAPSVPLNDEMVNLIKNDPVTKGYLMESFLMMLDFYGFELQESGVVVYNDPSKNHWSTPFNHNFLRITRIIGCMSICGFEELGKEFCSAVCEVMKDKPYAISSKKYWIDATTWR